MEHKYRVWVGVGAVAGLTAVLAAAGSAHLGEPRGMAAAVQLHGWHALALVACGIWGARGGPWVHWAGAAFVAGLLLFCGTVYAGAFGLPRLGMLAPGGGTLLMLGWALLGVSAIRR